ncbi:MAG TPA: hypothetical protein VFG20_10350, partial [Planctomycetaceae bacterium]|nr:hypothetical protein [Planctomycetaceae bacterium]
CTVDLLPTICALTGQPRPNRVLDGVDLTPVIDGKEQGRDRPLCFWEYQFQRLEKSKPQPWVDPALQEGTTPLVKLMAGKATRDFTNYRQPPITEDDYAGPRAVIDGRYKLVVHEQKDGVRRELFDLQSDPAERSDLAQQQP